MKEYMIQVLSREIDPEEGNPIGWVQVYDSKIYTDWVKCAVAYSQIAIAYPNNRYRIVSRNVGDWEECYR